MSETEDFTGPTSWWFASTACPLLAATFGPIASAFSVCALVYHWREYIPPDTLEDSGRKIVDPKWLLALNALSLISAVVGNAALLLNMTRRLKFSTAQPITISGFFMAGVLLIADMAALSSISAQYDPITHPKVPGARFTKTGAFYFAIFAASLYIIIGFLMCLTVHGAYKRYFPRDFNLTPAQRTLMIQTMGFVIYLLLGALVFSKIEGWRYLDAVYWADVTLLTIGLGDYSPSSTVGRGLIIPFAICGVLMVGLVIGSIRSLVLEHGKEKMIARIIEKRRESAVNNVDGRKQTIKVSWFAQADFSTDPSLSPAQQREEEFKVMRRVQKTAESERRYVALATSLSFALMLWFGGAAVFMAAEERQGWTYFQSVYFTFVALLTIGYGDFTPQSNAGKAFFVVWSLLAIPSLTILISDMGDTIVKWFSDIANWLGSLTILPGPESATRNVKGFLENLNEKTEKFIAMYTPFGKHDGRRHLQRMDAREHEEQMLESLAEMLEQHIEQDEYEEAMKSESRGASLERDMHFYNYVLSSELRRVQQDLSASPPKQYSWHEWEYFLKLMGDDRAEQDDSNGEGDDAFVPGPLRAGASFREAARPDCDYDGNVEEKDEGIGDKDGPVDRKTELRGHSHGARIKDKFKLHRRPTEDPLSDWSWLSEESPLMSMNTECEWIMEHLSATLVRELNRQRKGRKRQPPVGMKHLSHSKKLSGKTEGLRNEQGDVSAEAGGKC